MGLKESLRDEKVRDLPLREAVLVAPDTIVKDAIDRMREKRLGCAIVVNDAGEPVGTFGEAGLIDLLLAQPAAIYSAPVKDHLDAKWAKVGLDSPIAAVLRAMETERLRFVCVTDEQGKVAALTGQKGLMEYIAEHFPNQAMVQRLGGKPSMTKREGA